MLNFFPPIRILKSMYLIIIFSIIFSYALYAQNEIKNDVSQINKRTLPANVLDNYKQQEDFYYDRYHQDADIPWLMYVAIFIDNILTWLFGDKENDLISILFYALMFLLIIYFAYRAVKSDKTSPLELNAYGKIPDLHFDGENVLLNNSDELFKKAMKNKQYNIALRISYLKILKNLSDKEIIVLKPEKTNSEYLADVKKESLKSQFSHVINIFEYIWYGNVGFDEKLLLRFVDTFEEFNQTVLTEK